MTHRIEMVGSIKSFVIKLAFFMALLALTGLMYLESHALLDAVYFIVILTLFIRFIIMKLYQ